ncbi:hypothetical protein ACKWRH_46965 (plasmid) [Bradyrhizobium sp. Pa8]|uniref:Gfo/Idh/MocA family protein n=1 Tax=Bradyrhizobium sp. Pa8 TaxID=3386552 RepID=UPI00403F2178
MARHIFAEEPIEAVAMGHRPIDDQRFGEVEASIAALLRFPSGGLAQFVASFGAATVDHYRVVGTAGDLELDPGYRFETATKLRLRRDGEVGETQFPHIDHFAAQVLFGLHQSWNATRSRWRGRLGGPARAARN